MMNTQYYSVRAEQELAMTRAASSPQAAKIHYTLVGYYLDLCHGGLTVRDGYIGPRDAPQRHVIVMRSPE